MKHVPIKLLCIDFQRDFTAREGVHYKLRPSVEFIKTVLVPFLRVNGLRVAEIISDYRQPRPGHNGDFCNPGMHQRYIMSLTEKMILFTLRRCYIFVTSLYE